MIEKLEFSIGGFFAGYKNVKIWLEDGKLYKSYNGDFMDPETHYTEEIGLEEQKCLESRLVKLKIYGWKKEYSPEGYIICDGTQWELEYKEVGKRCRHITGDNEYPDCWNEFVEALGVSAPEILVELFNEE